MDRTPRVVAAGVLLVASASGVGSTRMACKDGMDTEGAFLPVLLRVRRWKITGQQLELSDSAGVALARFQARK